MNPLYTLELGQDDAEVYRQTAEAPENGVFAHQDSKLIVSQIPNTTPAQLRAFFGAKAYYSYHAHVAHAYNIGSEKVLGGTNVEWIPGSKAGEPEDQLVLAFRSESYSYLPESIAAEVGRLAMGAIDRHKASKGVATPTVVHVHHLKMPANPTNRRIKELHPRFQELCPEEVPASV